MPYCSTWPGSASSLHRRVTLALALTVAATACTPATNTTDASAAAPEPVVAANEPTPIAPTPDAPAPGTAATAARMQQCRAKLEAAIPSGLVTNASVDNGRPKLWVGPAWHTATPQMQEALARDAACFFLSGDESNPIRFSIYDTATGREVAVWDLTRLVMA